ncbi:ATP-binding protein, partial [Pseudomonas sp. KCJK9111]|uniref:ATP-binding protein n=1 Tax=Pseudomonas sp. KCJK9111 TaxID=3344555 RepID=UPI0039068DBA
MSSVHFRFSPNILVRLGEELNQGADQSILELIKNSYDADATKCVVELTDTGLPGGKIVVTDDGNGMTSPNIKDSWLVLGKSSKNSHQTTVLGRTPSGSKGLGRLAALRMGRTVNLESTVGDKGVTSVLKVNWDAFDIADTVEDVDLKIEEIRSGRPAGTR